MGKVTHHRIVCQLQTDHTLGPTSSDCQLNAVCDDCLFVGIHKLCVSFEMLSSDSRNLMQPSKTKAFKVVEMAGDDIKLLGTWASPFAMRVSIAFNIKSVGYELLEENLPAKSQLLVQSNPVHKKVPVLIHGGKPICESLVIVQYIDEVWSSGPAILPSDPYDRATARFWAAYIDDKWFASLSGMARAQDDKAAKAAIKQAGEGLALLEEAFAKCSKGKAFFGGDRIGYVDIVLGSLLGWLRVLENFEGVELMDGSKTPGLARWAERFCSDPVVKDLMPETDKLAEFAKVLFPRFRNRPSQ